MLDAAGTRVSAGTAGLHDRVIEQSRGWGWGVNTWAVLGSPQLKERKGKKRHLFSFTNQWTKPLHRPEQTQNASCSRWWKDLLKLPLSFSCERSHRGRVSPAQTTCTYRQLWGQPASVGREEKTNKLYRVRALRATANQRLVSGCTCWINDLPWQEIPLAILILIRLQGSGKNKNTSVIMTGSLQSHGKQLLPT